MSFKIKIENTCNYSEVNDIIYKVSYNTLKAVDQAIGHIKANKKLYKRIVFLFACSLSPMIANGLINYFYYGEGITAVVALIKEIAYAYTSLPFESFMKIMIKFTAEVVAKISWLMLGITIGKQILTSQFNNSLKKFNLR